MLFLKGLKLKKQVPDKRTCFFAKEDYSFQVSPSPTLSVLPSLKVSSVL